MPQTNKNNNLKESWLQYAPVIGAVLVISGLLLLLDQRIHTNWLSVSIPIFISLTLIVSGFITCRLLWLIPGFLLLGIGGGLFVGFQISPDSITQRIGFSLVPLVLSQILLFLVLRFIKKKFYWWQLFLIAITGGVCLVFMLTSSIILDFVFILSITTGLVFLLWGIISKKIGLIIPGLILGTSGSGIYFAWRQPLNTEGLQETGVMLVWFALGWILITVLSRIIDKRFIWWPLIPGGICAMVGSGLYIGGNPGNALAFLRNTGSIGLILFGVYLMLLKFGMKR